MAPTGYTSAVMTPRPLAVALLLLPLSLAAAPAGRPADKALAASQPLSEQEYRQGLETLRTFLVKRGEEADFAGTFIDDLERAGVRRDGRGILVTRGVFASFIKYETAWARKTRDGKNELVSAAQRRHEVERAETLKEQFKSGARASSPEFFRAFQAAVADVRKIRDARVRNPDGTQAGSAVLFADQVDNSYSHVDAGDEALDQGDAAGAIDQANQALADNPKNADALVLKAGAEYAAQDPAAAVADAQAALALDPGNQQAQAIVSLSNAATTAAGGGAALSDAGALARTLAQDGGAERAMLGDQAAAGAGYGGALSAGRPGMNPGATPALAQRLAGDLVQHAASMMGLDPGAARKELNRAVLLSPRNAQALELLATAANRMTDFNAALAASNAAIDLSPADPRAWFEKAHALGGQGDRAGMTAALEQAAALDSSYKPALTTAVQAAEPLDLTLLFGDNASLHPANPGQLPVSNNGAGLLKIMGGIGLVLLSSGFAVLMLKHDRRFVYRRG